MHRLKLPTRDVVSCPHCQLRQFSMESGQCKRCRNQIGIFYLEIPLPFSVPAKPQSSDSDRRRTIGGILREIRKSKGLNQAAFAQLVGANRSQISRIENGLNQPIKMLLRFAVALKVDKILLRI